MYANGYRHSSDQARIRKCYVGYNGPFHDPKGPSINTQAGVFISLLLGGISAGYAGTPPAGNSGLGNSLNPDGADATRVLDPEGLSSFIKSSRTPSGLIYKAPYSPEQDKKLNDAWLYHGSVEWGYLGDDGSENSAEFGYYRDWRDGPLLNYFDLSVWNKDDGYHLDAYGGGAGRDDQYYRLSGGQYGEFKINMFFNQTPRPYSRNAVTFFDGLGTQNVTLPETLVPGNNNSGQIEQALQFARHPELGIDRKQAAFQLEYMPWTGTTMFLNYKHRKRNGSRPFGGSFFPPFYAGGNAGGVVETAEPVDYATNEIDSGISYANPDLQYKLSYKGSFFVNENRQLTFENPFINLPGTDFLVERARIDLYPDNQFHQITADLAYRLPLQGQLTSAFSWSRMAQNDDLLPPTVNSGFNFTGIDLDQWNTVDSLPRQKADAEIDHLLFQVGAQLLPTDSLSMRTKFRYQKEDNNTVYTAFNPLTGEYGYISEDGAAGGEVFRPGAAQLPIHYRSIPFEKDTLQWNFDTDYRLTSKNKLGLGYHYQGIKYNHRERDSTDENRFKAFLSSRSLSWASMRLSYEYADRDGNRYDFNPYNEFYTSSLADFQPVLPEGSTPHTLADLRKFDLSSRIQNLLTAQTNFLIADDMDLLLSLTWIDNDYDASYGLQSDRSHSVNAEWNYQPFPALNSYAFYGFQNRRSRMANIDDTGFSADPNAGGVTFPLASAWSQQAEDTNHSLGLGFRYLFRRFDIDSRYSVNWSDSRVSYSANSDPGAGQFPDIEFTRHIWETSIRWHLHEDVSLRFVHRYEQGDIDDWHYRDLTPLIGNQLFLNATPQNYATHLFGIFIQFRLN